jgi:hypothetical protein
MYESLSLILHINLELGFELKYVGKI